jgi:hypothetical protein
MNEKLIQQIKSESLKKPSHFLEMKFYYHYYSALEDVLKERDFTQNALMAYRYFIQKTRMMEMVYRNMLDTAARAEMLPDDHIYDIMCGRVSTVISNASDTDKMGLMLGYLDKVADISPQHALDKILLFPEFML